jgi:hypothetical protein
MVRPIAFGLGKLGLRLALAFLGVALASIIVLSYITEISTGQDFDSFIKKRELAQTQSIAVSAGAMFMQPPLGWQHANLMPLLFFLHEQGDGADQHDTRIREGHRRSDLHRAGERGGSPSWLGDG